MQHLPGNSYFCTNKQKLILKKECLISVSKHEGQVKRGITASCFDHTEYGSTKLQQFTEGKHVYISVNNI